MKKPKCPYCIHCDAFVDRIDYRAKLETFEVKGGTVITCVEVSAYCRECGMELYVPEINDMNVLSRDNAYAAAVSHEMTAKEFVREHHRMCQSKMECAECRICHDDREPRSCAVMMGLNPDDTVAVVEQWAREHPEGVNDAD